MKRSKAMLVFVLLVLIAAAGCDSSSSNEETGLDGGSGDGDTDVDSGAPSVTSFATYNVGLAVGFVDYADDRQPFIEEALSGLTSDVVCLQEVWLPEQIEALVAASKPAFPHAYYEVTEDDPDTGAGGCSEEEVDTFGGCVIDNCSEVDPAELAGCALDACGTEFAGLSADCLTCVAANLGGTIEDILGTCGEGAAGSMAYDGHNGLILLSRLPLTDRGFEVLDSYLNRRVVLHARVKTAALGVADLYCTHLTANLSGVNYNGDHGSWEDERSEQIDVMIDYVDETRSKGRPAVLMGDLNCGPAKGGVEADFSAQFEKVTEAGFEAPYVASDEGACTWCEENPLTGGADSGDKGNIIDHVLFNGAPEGAVYEARRIMDEPLTLEIEGEEIDSRLSDHYGAEVAVTF